MIEKQLRKYIMPNILAMVGTSCYVLADTFFISISQGANGITALNLTLPVYGIIFAIGSMLGIGSATRYSLSKAVGARDADHYFSNSIIWTVLISFIFVVVGIFGADSILRFMGADDTILKIGSPYIKIALLFTPFFMLNYTFTSFVRNDNSPDIAMAATLLSGIFNIVFDYIFMFPLKMGMIGAALATGVSPIVSMLICMRHFLSKKNTVKFIFKMPSFKKMADSCKLGIVAFVGEISSGITTMCFNFILLSLVGNIAVAAYGVIANISIVGIALLNGVSQGLQPLASEIHGKNESENEKRIYNHALFIGILISVILVGSVILFAEFFVDIFNTEKSTELSKYAVTGIRLYFLGFLVATVNVIKAGFLSAIGKARESSIIAISRGVAAIVVFAFLLSRLFGITGVWLSFLASEIFTLILTIIITKEK